MNKEELVSVFAKELELSKVKTNEMISTLEMTILKLIAKGETLRLYNFIELGVRKAGDRTGTHPKTHEKMIIKGGFKPYVKFGKALKEAAKDSEFAEKEREEETL